MKESRLADLKDCIIDMDGMVSDQLSEGQDRFPEPWNLRLVSNKFSDTAGTQSIPEKKLTRQ